MLRPRPTHVRYATVARTPAADALAAVVVAVVVTLLIALLSHAAGAQAPDDTVPLAARSIARGRVLTADDVVLSPTATAADSAVIGRVARRVIAAGEALRAPAVAVAPMLRAGTLVSVVYRGGGLALTVRGTALGDASPGDRVNVRVDAQQRVEGVLAADGTVVVQGAAP